MGESKESLSEGASGVRSGVIRRALEFDAEEIHEAHMHSIRSVCSRDHSPREISAWAGRTLNTARWIYSIQNEDVWVVDVESKVEGFAHLRTQERESVRQAHVDGLYLTPRALGQGFGRELTELMIERAREIKVESMVLESTLTAHSFYLKMGFRDAGPLTHVQIGGEAIRCYPMFLAL